MQSNKDIWAVMPSLNAAATLAASLRALDKIPTVVSDGNSTDNFREIARDAGAIVIEGSANRGGQLAAGADAALARGAGWLLFLHADTVLGGDWVREIAAYADDPANAGRAAFFRFALDDASPRAKRLVRLVNWRSRTLGLPYGDQGLFLSAEFYRRLGGFRAIPLMEDVDMIRRIGAARLDVLAAEAVTSGEKFRRSGFFLRSARNLFCLGLFFAGLPTPLIARIYGR